MSSEILTILVVDDVDENRQILQRRLAKLGYNVELANDGREGLNALRNTLVDLVLLDINMPIMDGVAALAAIRADANLASIPVIMLTAIDDADTAVGCLKQGACGYITKPFNMDQLQQQISHCLNKK